MPRYFESRNLSIKTGQLLPAVGASARVRLPPQSPSRYIPGSAMRRRPIRPVAPAVSKSLHSTIDGAINAVSSGCPRSLQVATFRPGARGPGERVRLPPQSPSRYIRGTPRSPPARSPVAPAVSKSLHSTIDGAINAVSSGCPRSLQVATFLSSWQRIASGVRLPPQSPSRYIPSSRASPWWTCPVAPAVSKSLHSVPQKGSRMRPSGCPRSLQVATFDKCLPDMEVLVRLPPQSPSRYIPRRCASTASASPVAPAVSKSLHSRRSIPRP